MIDRKSLPYRKNCEGYFLYGKNEVIAKETKSGYLVFPGGGIDSDELPEEAVKREAMEEAGVILEDEPKKLGILHFDWEPDWAKTEKQKERYNKFKGEEMHFFIGKVKQLVEPRGNHEDAWAGRKSMLIAEAIAFINQRRPFSAEMKKYRNKQLNYLKFLMKNAEK